MGLADGWDEARFNEASRTTLPDGTPYQNLCIGCDSFHEQVLGPVLEAAHQARRLARGQPPLPAMPVARRVFPLEPLAQERS
jgi:hypothetical protein